MSEGGIWFPRDTEKPKLVWAYFAPGTLDYHHPCFDSFLGPDHGVLFAIPIEENTRRGLHLDYYLSIYYRDYDEIVIKSVHRAVTACHGMTVPRKMVGDYVLLSGRPYPPASSYGDTTLADFRHALDYFSTYFDNTIYETPGAGSVGAVKVSCRLEEALHGRDTFTAVAVSRNFPNTSGISDLSVALGDELRVCRLSRSELERNADLPDDALGSSGWHNPHSQAFMVDMDTSSDNWSKSKQYRDIDGSAILLREDGTDLDVQSAERICGYASRCLCPFSSSHWRVRSPAAKSWS
ncbi:hypothetical protein QBC33DRAFT_585819 [Phialemonium atrogriseum]|uniref:Uncharacterized protein n=1 Tax=Phialemonium atrogriseum TaxID=1093897 RepID=A0AAJ0C0C2_9PEZI|nr:uncharacterized protein QBC33DRAFT_585819 [Phialemonium atrogriseum]KAK1767784.1 hypothetical protein QBC33DRAFT_585819 [Phialemonium atrogriseum]